MEEEEEFIEDHIEALGFRTEKISRRDLDDVDYLFEEIFRRFEGNLSISCFSINREFKGILYDKVERKTYSIGNIFGYEC